jgi:hypothetical protein
MFGTNYTGGITDYRSAEEVNSAMGRVYGHMSMAVLVSMIVSYFVGSSPELLQFFFTGVMKWIVIFSPLVVILAFAFAAERFNKGQLQLFLYAFAALMGLSFATIFAVFTMGSIVSAFMSAGVLFAVMSGYGYFTKQSLSGWPGHWYQLSDVPAEIDLLIVDGPPWALHPHVRGAASSLFPRIRPGGRILLDDAARPGERVVALRWRKEHGNMEFTLDSKGAKGTLLGHKHPA